MYPFERFTEAAKRVLTLTQQEAERAHHSYIGTEHILLGLLREHDTVASVALDRISVDIADVRRSIDTILGAHERIVIQQIIPTSRVKTIIEISFTEARRMGDDFVGRSTFCSDCSSRATVSARTCSTTWAQTSRTSGRRSTSCGRPARSSKSREGRASRPRGVPRTFTVRQRRAGIASCSSSASGRPLTTASLCT